jgi:hypothetical protein
MAFQWTMKSVAFLWDLWSHSHRMTPGRLQHTFGWKLMWQIFMYVSLFPTGDLVFSIILCHDDCLFFQLLMDGATSVLEVVKIATIVSANIPTQVVHSWSNVFSQEIRANFNSIIAINCRIVWKHFTYEPIRITVMYIILTWLGLGVNKSNSTNYWIKIQFHQLYLPVMWSAITTPF